MQYFKTSFCIPLIHHKNKPYNINYVHPSLIPNKYISLIDSIYNTFSNKNTIELQDYLSRYRISNFINKFSIWNYNFGYLEIINKNKNYYNTGFLDILRRNFNVFYDNYNGIYKLVDYYHNISNDSCFINKWITYNKIQADGDLLCFSDDNSFIGCPIKAYDLVEQHYFDFENPYVVDKLLEYPIFWKICKNKLHKHSIYYNIDGLLSLEYKKNIIKLTIGDVINNEHPCYFPNNLYDLYDYLSKFKDKSLFDFEYKTKISYNDTEIKIGLKSNIIVTSEDLLYCCDLLHQREFLSSL